MHSKLYTGPLNGSSTMCGIHVWISCCPTCAVPQVVRSDDCWLKRRGPDDVSTATLKVGTSRGDQQDQQQQQDEFGTVYLTASVLQMRLEWQPQPVPLSATVTGGKEDDYSNDRSLSSSCCAYLAWNGEIYEVDHADNNHDKGTDDPAMFQGNDTLYIAKRLTKDLDWTTSTRDEQRETVLRILGSLTNAEYAICIVTEQSIFYARDSWGRRSLVISSRSSGGEFQLASVATNSRDDWTEVPPGILYEYQIGTEKVHETPFAILESSISSHPTSVEVAMESLESLMDRAVERRLRGHTSCSILFSGGLDSTLIAALALRFCPSISLLTVSFVDTTDAVLTKSADGITAKASYNELIQLFPQARISWNHRVVPYQAVEQAHDRLQELIRPKTTVMDWNIATALWFAASLSNDRLLLSGLGADELLGGYRRHKQASEVRRDQDRLWERNLGRDDRILSDHGTEVRFPYLDTHVVAYCRSNEEFLLQQNKETLTDKSILRKVAARLGLETAAGASKRAIQFGSRIAHVSDTKRFGSRRKATATAHVQKS